jgi:transposase
VKRKIDPEVAPSPHGVASSGERLRLPQRGQIVQLQMTIDELVHHSHPARTLWDVLTFLDLSAFHEAVRARNGVRGRDATDPRIHLGLWGMAAWLGVSSAREIANLAEINPGLCWIRGGVTVNHPMLSSFRSRHVDHFEPTLQSALTATLIMLRISGWWPALVYEQDPTNPLVFIDTTSTDLGWAKILADTMVKRLQKLKRGRPSGFQAGQNQRGNELIDSRRQSMAQSILAKVLRAGKNQRNS